MKHNPPRWRVECPTKADFTGRDVVGLNEVEEAHSWTVVSPLGVKVWRSRDRAAAIQVATSLAAVDELLARIRRLERATFGNHPALNASARATNPVNGIARRERRDLDVSILGHNLRGDR